MSQVKKPRNRKSSSKGKGLTSGKGSKAAKGTTATKAAKGRGSTAGRSPSRKDAEALLLEPRLQKQVMAYLRQDKGRAIGVAELAREMSLDITQTRHVRQFLKSQAHAGLLELRRRGRYILRDLPIEMQRKVEERRHSKLITKQREDSQRPAREEPPEGTDSLSVLDVAEFPEEVTAEAIRVAQGDLEAELPHRLDLRETALFTIDGDDAKDFDDAVGYVPLEGGHHRVIVAIADVAHYVKEGTPLGIEAARRATSVYLPGICYPMLPEALSNGACSLRPNEDRLALVAFLEYDDQYTLVDSSFHEAIICSKARFTYDQVAKVLDDMEPDGTLQTYRLRGEIAGLEGLEPSLWSLDVIAKALRAKRFQRGAMDLDMPEPKFVFGPDGELKDIIRLQRNRAHFLIEELMLQANEATAGFLLSKDLPGVYRNHGAPNTEKLEQLMEVLSHFGVTPPPMQSAKKAKHEYDQLWDFSPTFFSTLFETFGDHPAKQLFQYWFLRCMQQATYDSENMGHFGLSLEQYLHFTSPIRRFPDLCVHRSLKKYLRGELDSSEKARLRRAFDDLAGHSSVRERMAMKAERDAVNQQRARFMESHIGEEATGAICAVAPFGFFVQLDDFFVEGLVHARTFQGSFFYDETTMSLSHRNTGERFQLGDRLRITIENASAARGEIDFRVVARLPFASKEAAEEA